VTLSGCGVVYGCGSVVENCNLLRFLYDIRFNLAEVFLIDTIYHYYYSRMYNPISGSSFFSNPQELFWGLPHFLLRLTTIYNIGHQRLELLSPWTLTRSFSLLGSDAVGGKAGWQRR